MPDHSTPSPEDRFADALDALTLGMPVRSDVDSPLTQTAAAIGQIGPEFDKTVPVPLDRATKGRIWAELMAEHGGTPDTAPMPQTPGAAGGMLPLNPWVTRGESSKPKRPRPSPGVLRVIPSAQPTSTFLLVVAVLVLVGGTFASLAPGGGRGIFPSALATEDSAQLAYATPEASPVADACAVDPASAGSGNPLPDRLYRSGGSVVPDLHAIYISSRWEQIVACGPFDGVTGEIPRTMMTDRRTTEDANADPAGVAWIVTDEEADAILGYPLAWHELEEMERIRDVAMEATLGVAGDALAAEAGLGVYRQLADGRIAFYSGEYWLAEDGRIEPAGDAADRTHVTVHIFAQQDRQWLYDETLSLCIGPCEGFETSGATKPRLTIATPDDVDRQWLSPLMNKDCLLSAEERAATPPALPSVVTDPANYVPFATADEADQVAAATTFLRVASGCEAPTDASLVVDGGGAVLAVPGETGVSQSQLDTAQAISEALGYTDPIEILIANAAASRITDGNGVYTLHPQRVLLPNDVVQLPDGRLGGMLRIQSLPDEAGV
ncbi:MAG: hypothetical protein H0V37_08985 [Chloroflexia bacterium]|nr:hypothetical protein [Chloroflexia bacterium]